MNNLTDAEIGYYVIKQHEKTIAKLRAENAQLENDNCELAMKCQNLFRQLGEAHRELRELKKGNSDEKAKRNTENVECTEESIK